MNYEINRLIQFALDEKMITEDEMDYSVNLLLDLFDLDEFHYEEVNEPLPLATPILENMLDYVVANGKLENTITNRDLFDTRIMNCVMPRPHFVIETFKEKYAVAPKKATDYYYRLSIASNYIRKSRTDKNIIWKSYVKYGNFEISINLSKPEKDPKEIAKAKEVKATGYPKCLLCKENVGFRGDLNRAARQNHRIIPLQLANGDYYLQYSPYVYYNEHCIVLNKEHKPMVINQGTFENLLSFLDLFPHYMIGSNADLPIVGGSILTHDHYQGGNYEFPIQEAEVLKTFELGDNSNTVIEVIRWPLSTIRITCDTKERLVELAMKYLNAWKEYNAPVLDIISHTGTTPHNTITPIARKKGNKYQMDLVLRNNRTSDQYPDGIFHPHPESHHIKKENIGLIEVMGLAILPARLKDELLLLKECLLQKAEIKNYPELEKHYPWFITLMNDYQINEENVDEILKEAVAIKFVNVLEDAGVFKMDERGIDALTSFVATVIEEEV
ncbi:UDP-glucose--hexose-1-phosphate uridylyltransferase [uncultured Thomasclavelia sp.]|uniref:UDP-glucose--hexose-1-phosphate uridylyltransferase n=1 Tax=uncultured Thomasclavelia sp. TaxID=3025759 RepID=UPI00280AA2A5|nr:UDP-glucose--hexose-1-phosphate uridylyltransferase [uncultured Thomasclavelia sp.]